MRPFWLLPLLLLPAACEGPADSLDFERDTVPVWKAATLTTPADPAPKRLRVMAWNIKYGAGRLDFWFDYWGDTAQMTLAQVDANMKALYKAINEVDPDILIAEEIEVNSRRSAYYDMVQGILDNTKLNYAMYGRTWNTRYIAQEGVGRMDLGNAIFSKYPITKAERIRQADRTDQDALTKTFYIHRAVARAEVEAGPRKLAVYGVHTEAYDFDGTKRRHIEQIHGLLKAETLPFLCGGDFNELPPGSIKTVSFPDEKADCGDYCQPPYHPEDMKPFYDDFEPYVQLNRYGQAADGETDAAELAKVEEKQSKYYTHTVLGPDTKNDQGALGFWNRTLDYLFVTKGGDDSKWIDSDVLQGPGRCKKPCSPLDDGITSETMDLSDHAPVVGVWQVAP